MRHVTSFLQNLALLTVRICFGLLLVTHAWHRYKQLGIPHEIDYLSTHHVPHPTLLAWGATLLEGVGGVLLVFGLAVPLVALALVAQNVLTIYWLKYPHGVFHFHDGFELNLVEGLLSLVLLCFGSGRAGLDALFGARRREDNERIPVREIP